MRISFIVLLFITGAAYGQGYNQPDAAHIKLKLKKLNVLGSVLYVAAHPDDENTRVITKFANENLYATGYLSMTRGDGGQNLVGEELGDQLGVLRTQELLAARRIDGGEQFFTRAIDFGFSKSADETLRIWGKDEILSDVVKVYRQFQPDVIITRFPPTEKAGHGHHTSSAILAEEAFDLSVKTDAFPAQVKKYGVWQPVRILTNTGRWWNNTINENTPGVITLNVGKYSPLLGESFSEIAARSRSQHKSQGFGSSGVRGGQQEFLEFVKGAAAKSDPMEGINTSWTRVKGGDRVQPLVEKAINSYDPERPYELVPLLQEIHATIKALPQSVWRQRKLEETEQLILDCLGLYIEVSADEYQASPGRKVAVQFEFVNRSPVNVSLQRVVSDQVTLDTTVQAVLKNNVPLLFKTEKVVANTLPYSTPFWLKEPHSLGRFAVSHQEQIGKAANDAAALFKVELLIGNEKLLVNCPVIYKWTDPVKGELRRPFEIVPPIVVSLTDQVIIFNDNKAKAVSVQVSSLVADKQEGTLRLKLPRGWKAEPGETPFSLSGKGVQQHYVFNITPPSQDETAIMKVEALVGDKSYSNALETIDYAHIPVQTLLPEAEAKVVHIDLQRNGSTIAYIKGAGDEVPAALRNMGFNVLEMKEDEVTRESIQNADAVVLGIRALNTSERISRVMDHLLEYVKEGGTMVVQYNTSFDLEIDKFSPYELKISRNRVTDENSEVRILKPDHPVMNIPNKITQRDFDGWVQERGLYFPGSWSNEFEAILSMNDKDEKPSDGSLLVARYGKGYYVYTGLSFFRELPAGVSGAYRLFANIVSLGKSDGKVLK